MTSRLGSSEHEALALAGRQAPQMSDEPIRALLVSEPWGCGTTAVAGLVARLGAASFRPHFSSHDPRTPITYEFVPFRDAVRRHDGSCNRFKNPGFAGVGSRTVEGSGQKFIMRTFPPGLNQQAARPKQVLENDEGTCEIGLC
jgi:hypothetical protein